MVDVSRVELHELRPGDVIIATVAKATAAGADLVRQHLERKFPGHPVVVKSDQVDITFARPVTCDECGQPIVGEEPCTPGTHTLHARCCAICNPDRWETVR